MRALLCLALASVFASTAVASTAHAATAQVSTAQASAALLTTPISLGEAIELKNDVEGQYRLENGRDVRLVQVDHKLYLDLNRHYRKELLPVAENVLASRDGRLTVQYMPHGPVEQILIQHPELPASLRLGERSWDGR
ncbi:hypothetical protein [Massilia niabensis]|uniref:Uncharacterized protein n=1 Tax=Massilia niabensis TaxID=544910 RepID=A0ABW0L2R3_9BURK